MTNKLLDIDLELEKIVFLYNAEEGNPGIYELTWELSYYDLTIEDKYKIAHNLLTDLLSEGLVVLDKFTDLTLQDKIDYDNMRDAKRSNEKDLDLVFKAILHNNEMLEKSLIKVFK